MFRVYHLILWLLINDILHVAYSVSKMWWKIHLLTVAVFFLGGKCTITHKVGIRPGKVRSIVLYWWEAVVTEGTCFNNTSAFLSNTNLKCVDVCCKLALDDFVFAFERVFLMSR